MKTFFSLFIALMASVGFVSAEKISYVAIGDQPNTIASGTCGDNLTWTLTSDSVLTISGTGQMWIATSRLGWRQYNTMIKTVVFPEGITSIGIEAFANCTNLVSAPIPEGVDSIAPRAFYNCSSLTTVNMPNSLRALGTKTFVGCNSLTEPIHNAKIFGFMPRNYSGAYSVPEGIVSVAAYAFAGCTSLTEIELPSTTLRLGINSLGAPNLTKITCAAAIPPTCNTDVFKYTSEGTGVTVRVDTSIPVRVPSESLAAYQSANQWKDFFNYVGETSVIYKGQSDNELFRELVALHVPDAPSIAGFTFLKWQVVGGDLADGIIIQALYTADSPSSAPEVYVNPANPAQKLIRNGNVYILRDGKTYDLTGKEVQ